MLAGSDYRAMMWALESLWGEILGKYPQGVPVWPRLLLPKDVVPQQTQDAAVGVGCKMEEACADVSPPPPLTSQMETASQEPADEDEEAPASALPSSLFVHKS